MLLSLRQILLGEGYAGPRLVAERLNKLVSNKDARIVDIGAGTGLVGEEVDYKDQFPHYVTVVFKSCNIILVSHHIHRTEYVEFYPQSNMIEGDRVATRPLCQSPVNVIVTP